MTKGTLPMINPKFIKNSMKIFLLSSAAFIVLEATSHGSESFQPYAKGTAASTFMVYGKNYLANLQRQGRCLSVTASGKTPQQLSDAIVACLEKERNDALALQAQQVLQAQQQQVLLAQQEEQAEALRRERERAELSQRAATESEQRRQEEERARLEAEQRRQEEERARLAAEQETQIVRRENEQLQTQLEQRTERNLANLPRFSGGLLEALMQLTFQSNQSHVRGTIRDFTGYLSQVGTFVLEHVQLINNDIGTGRELREYLKFSRPKLPTQQEETNFLEMREQANILIREAFHSITEMHNVIKDAIAKKDGGTDEEKLIAENLEVSSVWEALDILFNQIEKIDLTSPHGVEQAISILKAEDTIKSLSLLVGKDHLLQLKTDKSGQNVGIFLRDKAIDFLTKNRPIYFDAYRSILRLHFLIQPTLIEDDIVEQLNIIKYIPNLKERGSAKPFIQELSEFSNLINVSLSEEKKSNYAKMVDTLLNEKGLDTIKGIRDFVAKHNEKARNVSNSLTEIANKYISRTHLGALEAWFKADNNIRMIRTASGLSASWAPIRDVLQRKITDIRTKINDYAGESTTIDFNKKNSLLSIQAAIDEIIQDKRKSQEFLQEFSDFHVDVNPYDNSFIESFQRILNAKARYDTLQEMVVRLGLLEQITAPGATPSREIFDGLNNIIRIYNDSVNNEDYKNVLVLPAELRTTLYSHILPLLYVEFPNSSQNNFPPEWKNIDAPIVQHIKNTFTAYIELKEALFNINPESLQSKRFDYLDLSVSLGVESGAPSSSVPPPPPSTASVSSNSTQIPAEIKLKMDNLNAFLKKIDKWSQSVPREVAQSYYTNLFNQLIKPFYTKFFAEYPDVAQAKELLLSEIGKLTDKFINEVPARQQMREFYLAKLEEAINSPEDTPEFISLKPEPSAFPIEASNPKNNDFFKEFLVFKAAQRNSGTSSSSGSGNVASINSGAPSSSSSGNMTATSSRRLTVRNAAERMQAISSSNPMLAEISGIFDRLGGAEQRDLVKALDKIPGTGEVSNEALIAATLVANDIAKDTPVSPNILNDLKQLNDPAKHTLIEWSLVDVFNKRNNISNVSLPAVDSKFDDLLLEWTIKVQENNKAALRDQWIALKVNALITSANPAELPKFYATLAIITLANREVVRKLGGTNPLPAPLEWETYGKDYLTLYFEGDHAIDGDIRPSGFVEAIREYRDGR